jgi:predicted glycoside hydrolase/deacetylase ChbG (UPF0249 family)
MSKALVLCADDYALNPGVTHSILTLARQARLSATSVMVLSPRWADDAVALRELRGQIDVGLHLDWTSDFARAAGHGEGLAAVMWRSLRRGFDAQRVRDTVSRQLDAFEAQWQAPPDHVDGHQHIQQFPGLREPLLDVLQQRYGTQARKPWLRISQVAQPGLKAWTIGAMGASALQQWAQDHAWPHVSPLLGAYGFEGDEAAYAQRMAQWLQRMPETALLMCHPATQAQADDAIGPARVWEHRYLLADSFTHALQAAQVRLVRGTTLCLS